MTTSNTSHRKRSALGRVVDVIFGLWFAAAVVLVSVNVIPWH